MEILSQINNELNQALKEKNELVILVLRQLKTALSNAEIANNREPLSDEQITKLLRTEVKRRQESAELYDKGGREELATKERQEIDIIKAYLPPELSPEQVREHAQKIIAEVGASGPQDMGKVMGKVMAACQGQADGAVVKQIVTEELSK